jgi:hypothetical protein
MKCQAELCQNEATHVYAWRTETMPEPASWYGCLTHTAEWLAKGLHAGMLEAGVAPLLPESFQQSPE